MCRRWHRARSIVVARKRIPPPEGIVGIVSRSPFYPLAASPWPRVAARPHPIENHSLTVVALIRAASVSEGFPGVPNHLVIVLPHRVPVDDAASVRTHIDPAILLETRRCALRSSPVFLRLCLELLV